MSKRIREGLSLGAFLLLSLALLLLADGARAQTYYGTALVKPAGVVNNCGTWATSGSGAVNALTNSGVGCSGGNVTVDDPAAGSAILTPNAYGLGAAALLNNKAQKPVYFTRSVPTTGQDAGDFTCFRDANYTGSPTQPAGFVNPCLYSYTVARAGTGTGTPSGGGFEWSGLFRLDNYSNAADGTENAAFYAQARKLGTAPTWGFLAEIYDETPNPTTGSVADEHDVSVKGTDNNNARVGFDLFARNPWDATPSEVAWGMRLNTDAVTTIKNGITFNGTYGNGINLAPATINQAAIILGDGHAECYDSACLRKKFFSAGVTYQSVPTLGNIFSWSDAGQFSAVTLNTGSDLLFNGVTSSYPMLRRNAATVDVKKADNSGYTDVNAERFVANGGRYCLDITCVRSWQVSGGVLYWATGSGNVASITDPGALTAASLNTSGGDVLFGGATSAYPMFRRNSATIDARKADNSGYTDINVERIVANGARLCMDITCVRSWYVQGGVNYWNTSSGNTASFTDAGAFATPSTITAGGAILGPTLTASNAAGTFRSLQFQTTGSQRWVAYADATAESGANAGTDFGINRYSDTAVYLGTPLTIKRSTGDVTLANNLVVTGNGTAANIIVPTGGKVCFDGATCSTYLKYDGAFNVQMWSSGVAFASFNIFNQTFGTTNGFTVGANTGVTCAAGISAATFRSVLGIVTHC